MNNFRLLRISVTLIPGFFLISCGGSGSTDNNGGTAAYSLENCTTTVGAGVPAFFSKYFKCSTLSLSSDGQNVIIESNSLPPHLSYYYGASNANYMDFNTQGGLNSPNPNTISEQSLRLEFPIAPAARGLVIDAAMVDGVQGSNVNEYRMNYSGIALDSVSMYNSLAAPPDDINDEKFTFDDYNAHPTGFGGYHYHTNTAGPLEVLQNIGLPLTSTVPESAEIELYGVMCDGTVIMGCTELNGDTPASGDFDAQNGHVHDLIDETTTSLLGSRYHTHVCPGTYTTHAFNPEIQYYDTCL